VIDLVSKLTNKNEYLKKWFQNVNNIIGFCSSISNSFNLIDRTPIAEFQERIMTFEGAFGYFDVSKIRVGDVRRKTISLYIKKYKDLKDLDEEQLIDLLSQEI
jgi:hypothetical protein